MRKTFRTCPRNIGRDSEGTPKDINNNDNNILFNLFINNKEQDDFVPFKEGDEVSRFLKTKGINSIEEYKKLDKTTQEELIEEWFFKNR